MRLKSLILWDIRFQIKYGFYLLYAILTALYIAGLSALPDAWRETAGVVLIFSDPAAIGLFFMGAIILLEKSQRLPEAYAVSPVKALEYIAAKVLSLCLISLVAAAALAIAAGAESLPTVLAGTGLCSILFTLLSIIVASKISSLNQFMLWAVPVELITLVPGLLHLFQLTPDFLQYYPIHYCIDLIGGNHPPFVGLAVTLLSICMLFFISGRCVLTMWRSAEGIKL